MPYDSVPEVPVDPKQRQPVGPPASFRTFRTAYTHDPVKCTKCGKECESFADGLTADGTVLGWLPICNGCFTSSQPAAAPVASPAVPAPARPSA